MAPTSVITARWWPWPMTHWSPVAAVVSAGRWSSALIVVVMVRSGVRGVRRAQGSPTSTGMVGDGAASARRTTKRAPPRRASGPTRSDLHPRGTSSMRILITNDDGVFAPGIAALARGLLARLRRPPRAGGGGPAGRPQRGRCRRRPGLRTRVDPLRARSTCPDWPAFPVFGIDGPPALAVILACIEGFGPRPDLVVSGINHGINAGRSALHSGTVGATLTAAQFGVRGLAVSIAWARRPGSVGDAGPAGCRHRARAGRSAAPPPCSISTCPLWRRPTSGAPPRQLWARSGSSGRSDPSTPPNPVAGHADRPDLAGPSP